MLPSATPLAQCFIELCRETAANRGFLRTDLETILLFHRATLRDGSESRLFEDRSRDNLTEFLFGGLRSSESSLSSESFGMTHYEYLRLNHESKRFDLLIIATRPRRTLRCSSYFSKQRATLGHVFFSKPAVTPELFFNTTNQLMHRIRLYST